MKVLKQSFEMDGRERRAATGAKGLCILFISHLGAINTSRPMVKMQGAGVVAKSGRWSAWCQPWLRQSNTAAGVMAVIVL